MFQDIAEQKKEAERMWRVTNDTALRDIVEEQVPGDEATTPRHNLAEKHHHRHQKTVTKLQDNYKRATILEEPKAKGSAVSTPAMIPVKEEEGEIDLSSSRDIESSLQVPRQTTSSSRESVMPHHNNSMTACQVGAVAITGPGESEASSCQSLPVAARGTTEQYPELPIAAEVIRTPPTWRRRSLFIALLLLVIALVVVVVVLLTGSESNNETVQPPTDSPSELGSLAIEWVGVIDNGQGDDESSGGPEGIFHYFFPNVPPQESFDINNYRGEKPELGQWLDGEQHTYDPPRIIHPWQREDESVYLVIYEDEPDFPFVQRDEDPVFSGPLVNRKDLANVPNKMFASHIEAAQSTVNLQGHREWSTLPDVVAAIEEAWESGGLEAGQSPKAVVLLSNVY